MSSALSGILNRREPILYLVSTEESRVEAEIQKYCRERSPALAFFRWSSTLGLQSVREGVIKPVSVGEDGDARSPAPLLAVLHYIVRQCTEDGIFVLKDVHQFLRGGAAFNLPYALTVRALRDAFYELRALGVARKIVLLCPDATIPTDLEKEVRICEFPLPSRAELGVTVAG